MAEFEEFRDQIDPELSQLRAANVTGSEFDRLISNSSNSAMNAEVETGPIDGLLDYCIAATNFPMSANAERLASHSRNSLSKTESTLKRSGWQECNFARYQNWDRLDYVSQTTKAARCGRPLRLMASHWPPENAPGGKLHSIR